MAIRSDLTYDFNSSPRVITVNAPSTEIVIQDIIDSCRNKEASVEAIDNVELIDAAGKENLGGGTKVGLTATLQNAQIAFEARLGPDWILCSIAGGNLVAIDDVGADLDPRKPTAYTTIDRTSSASATLQEQDALQYSSYQNGVWVDVAGSNSGTEFPVGTREYPVNNVPEAVDIANEKGFDTLFVIGSLTLDTGDDVSNMKIIGTNPMLSELTVESGAITDNVYIHDVNFSGTLDGGSILRDCIIGEVFYFNGYIENCALTSNTIYINGIGILLNCFSGPTCTSHPIIDLTDALGLGIRGHSGSLDVVNKTEDVNCEINLDGQLTLDSSITAGSFNIYGDGYVINNSGGSAVLNDKTTGTPAEIS